MAGNNRKQAVSYSVLIPSIWWHNLGFGEPIQAYSSSSNQPKTAIVRVVETSRVNSINRGGDLGKSGPGPRAKTTRYITVYTTARVCTRIFVYGSGLSTAVKGAKWINRLAKAHRLIDKSPENITENLFDSLSEID